ncbi:uncharacterized protein VNE69_03027 [Vairimorpha necatrix]|uniref:Uncharacterized protein n=1 Tax=Vairimorpha necatrix TaxID=6039 RepID=A0AAX4JA84_9MICR
MDLFDEINKNRLRYNFPSKEYKSIMLKNKSSLLYHLELNTCKFYLLNSKKYLKKNLKLSTDSLYSEYIHTISCCDINKLLILRSKLEHYDSFIKEIDNLLTNQNFDINKIKSIYKWNDIEITFSTKKKQADYINKCYKVEDKKYNNQIVMFITKLENKIRSVKKLLKKDNSRVKCIRKKFENVKKVTEMFLNFLNENYVESEYLNNLRNEVENILKIDDVSSFSVNLFVFDDVSSEIVSMRDIKSKKEVKEDLILYLKGLFEINNDQLENVPFIPDFYDIAYDYIKYPETNINELLKNITIN